MVKDKIRQIGVILATVVMLVNNVLASAIPYNGVTTMEASKSISIYFIPASYAFSIWGLIYMGLLAYTVYQALPSQKENDILRKIGWWYVAGIGAFSTWMVFFHFQVYLIATVMMICLLISLVVIYTKLGTGITQVSCGMRYLVQVPFSLFLGWVTMSTIGNLANLLQYFDWKGLGIDAKNWAVVMMVVTIVIAELTAFNRQDLAYLAVFVWSFIGIAVNNSGVTPVFEAACVSAAIVIIITVITLIMRPKKSSENYA
ncbi:MAG: tryptophan-rich sensory protein [Chloroflexi bacterium HGW-Chloroflexi-5]|jgi:hypothetical protein|nr:MAG: tryptophan-rich sensory protein [Chloroflexi bacterium HGW-Chloroflexi-5]